MSNSGSVDGIKRNLFKNTESLNKSNEKLSSGKRINKGSDDPAGLAVAASLNADTVVLTQASRNISDGSSISEIKDAVYSSLSDISIRQQELAAQSSNGTLNDSQRASLNQEFQALTEEANRIVNATTYNGQQVIESNVTLQVGTDSSSSSQITISDNNIKSIVSQLSNQSIDSIENAQSALTTVQSYAEQVSQSRGQLGAESSRLDSASSSIESKKEANQIAESRVRDADIAEELSRRIASEIGQRIDVALLAQASKLNTATALNLLR
jgi:flagellin